MTPVPPLTTPMTAVMGSFKQLFLLHYKHVIRRTMIINLLIHKLSSVILESKNVEFSAIYSGKVTSRQR